MVIVLFMKSIIPDNIRIIALDLDDTLLRSDLSISARTRDIVRRIQAMGITVVLASGRIPEAMEKYARFLGLHRNPGYLISNNGALIQESDTGTVVYESLLDRHTIMSICDLAEAEGLPLQMYADNITYISKKNDFSAIDENYTGLRQVVVENFRDLAVEGCYELTIPGDPVLLESVKTMIETYLEVKISMFISRKYFLQITPDKTDKGTALEKITGILKFDESEVMAFGDSMNDESMLNWAGFGIAMANGNVKLKEIANMVTDLSNDEDGVADFIEKNFFGLS